MSDYIINGGKPLDGEIEVKGSKNAVTKAIIASLLTDEECLIKNSPQIDDVEITAELCRLIGSQIKKESSNLTIVTPKIKNFQVNSLSRGNRIPILSLGPLLVRAGKAELPILGGDKIGPRPVDIHLNALRAMGAKVDVLKDRFLASAPNGLKGAEIEFHYPSVGATENTILAAVLANGRTIIKNAATEPEVLDLIKMLQKMGAIIELGANRIVYIDGVKKLKGVRHRILPDRNEAVSFACLAIATNGRIKVKNAVHEHLITFLNALRRIGGEYKVEDDGIVFWKPKENKLSAVKIETDTHPGFMTDWQQPFAVLLTQSRGESVIHETVYEDRFGYAEDLNLMGASIKVLTECLGELNCRFKGKGYSHSAIISGPRALKGSKVVVRDLRSGIAHLIAGLAAQGRSIIKGAEEVERGYERIEDRLQKLGANIYKISN